MNSFRVRYNCVDDEENPEVTILLRQLKNEPNFSFMNFNVRSYGIVVGGQNDGANAADLVDTYREGEARGSDYLE